MAMSENATNMYARGREFKMGVVSFTRDKTQLFIWSTYLEFWWFHMCISSVNWFAGIRFTSSDCNGKIRRLIYRNLSNWIPPKVTRHSSMFSQWFLNLLADQNLKETFPCTPHLKFVAVYKIRIRYLDPLKYVATRV